MHLQAHERMLGVRGFGEEHLSRAFTSGTIPHCFNPSHTAEKYAQTNINSFPKGSVMFDLAQDRLISYKNTIAWIPGDELES